MTEVASKTYGSGHSSVEAYASEIGGKKKSVSQHPLGLKSLFPGYIPQVGPPVLFCLTLSFTYNKHVHKNACLNVKLIPLISLFLGTAGPPYIHKRLQSYTGIKTMVSSVNKYLTVQKQ